MTGFCSAVKKTFVLLISKASTLRSKLVYISFLIVDLVLLKSKSGSFYSRNGILFFPFFTSPPYITLYLQINLQRSLIVFLILTLITVMLYVNVS